MSLLLFILINCHILLLVIIWRTMFIAGSSILPKQQGHRQSRYMSQMMHYNASWTLHGLHHHCICNRNEHYWELCKWLIGHPLNNPISSFAGLKVDEINQCLCYVATILTCHPTVIRISYLHVARWDKCDSDKNVYVK